MRLSTVQYEDRPRGVVRAADGTLVLLDVLLDRNVDVIDVLEPEALAAVNDRLPSAPRRSRIEIETPGLVSHHPGLILGIGLNYGAHAGDLGEDAPRTTPASFLKGRHTIVGPSGNIEVPAGIGRITAEAELGLVIGRRCHRVPVETAIDHVAGIVAVLDQTAEGVLLENPRYLTRVKNYPTFFSFGPEIITMDEVREHVGDLADLRVATVHNEVVHREDTVAGMTFSPAELLSFHSHVMPFEAGDILSTGTPGAAGIVPGDVVRCELGEGLTALENAVVAGPPGELMPHSGSADATPGVLA